VAFGVVAFSIFVQGLTILPLLRRELPAAVDENLSQPE
jgi:NhaP-type Na+/H+ or K+/H+ antiporter